MTDAPYVYRTSVPHDDTFIPDLLAIAAEERLLVAIRTGKNETTLTFYDPAEMPRSPSIWGKSERLGVTWPDYMANDDPLLA